MATITTRAGKGSPLTNTEVDDNFSNLNSAKYESGANPTFAEHVYLTPSDSNGTNTTQVAIGHNRTGNGYSHLDFVGDTTYSDYGFRIIRGNTGANAKTEFTHRGTGKLLFNAPDGGNEIVFNEGSSDTDFRVESNGNTHAIFVNAGADGVGFGATASPLGSSTIEGMYYEMGGSLTVASNTETLQINRNGTGGNNRTNIGLYNNGTIRGTIGTLGGQDGLYFQSGGNVDNLQLQDGVSVFNESSADIDFRVESDNYSHMLFVNAGADAVTIGGSDVGTHAGIFNVAGDLSVITGSGNPKLTIKTGGAGNNPGIDYRAGDNIVFDNLLIASAATDYWRVGFGTSGTVTTEVLTVNTNSRVGIQTTDPDAEVHISGSHPHIDLGPKGGNRAKLGFRYNNLYLGATSGGGEVILKNNINSTDAPDASGDEIARFGDAVVFNEGSRDQDFRVESNDNTNMIFVDAGSNEVGIGTGNPGATFDVAGTSRARDMLITQSSGYATLEMSGPSGAFIDLKAGDTDYNGRIITFGSGMTIDTASGEDLKIQTGGENRIQIVSGGETVVNEPGNDRDFRVESDSNAHMLFVDASTNRVGIGHGSPNTLFSVQGAYAGQIANFFDTGSNGDAMYNGAAVLGVSRVSNGTTSLAGPIFEVGRDNSTNGTYNVDKSFLTVRSDATVVNEDSEDYDFRVESTGNSHMLFVDAGLNQIGIAEPPIDSTFSTAPLVVQARTKYVDNTMYALQLNSSTYSDTNEFTTMLGFAVEDSGWSKGAIGFTRTASYDTGYLGFYVVNGGTAANAALSDEVLRLTGGEVVVNDRSRSHLDFRVESDSYSHAIYVDSSTGHILFGRSSHSWTANNFYVASPVNGGIAVTANGDWGLQMAGQRAERIRFFSSAGGSVTVGNVSVSTFGTTYSTTSDRRLKENIQTITDATGKLMAMNPVEHTWKADPEADAVHGFIAQEMMDIVPEAVSGDPEGDEMMAMDYGRITPVLVAALQDAHKKIAGLETRLNELEGK